MIENPPSVPAMGETRQWLGYYGSGAVIIALGVFTGMFAVPLQVFMQSRPPDECKGRMIAASFLYPRLPRPGKFLARLIARALTAVIFGLLTWRSFLEASAKTRIGAFALSGSDRITIWPAYWVLPVAFALVTIAVLLPPSRASQAAAET